LAGLLAGRRVARFSFRGRRPAFHGSTLRLQAWADGETWRLRTLDATGAVCMEAEASLG
jgi:3-methylfumaryl-CoA hydratase